MKSTAPKKDDVKIPTLPKMPPVVSYNRFSQTQNKGNSFTPKVFRVTQHKG